MSVPRRSSARLAVVAAATLLACAGVASGHPTNPLDVDHDLLTNDYDNCPSNYNPKQQDNDQDSVPKSTAVPPTQLPGQNGQVGGNYYGWTEGAALPTGEPDPRNRPVGVGGDACDEDDDNDGFPDKRSTKPEYRGKPKDNCPKHANPGQEDADSDGAGDACDTDDDNDEVLDGADNCALVSNANQRDSDRDGTGDACDPDAPKGGGSLAGGDPNDKSAPQISIGVARTQRFRALTGGLTVRVRCSEGCQVEGVLSLDGRTARKLRMAKSARKPLVVARSAAQIEDKGVTYVFVRIPSKTLDRLERGGRLRPRLVVIAKDANGNAARATKRLTLRR